MRKLLIVFTMMLSLTSLAQVKGVDVLDPKYVNTTDRNTAVYNIRTYNKKMEDLMIENPKLRNKFDADLNNIFKPMFKNKGEEMRLFINYTKDNKLSEELISNALFEMENYNYNQLITLAVKYSKSKSKPEKDLGNLILDAYTNYPTISYYYRIDYDKLDYVTIHVKDRFIKYANYQIFDRVTDVIQRNADLYTNPIKNQYR